MTYKDCLHSDLCKFRQDLCVTENLQNVDKECPFFTNKHKFKEIKNGEWEQNGRCTSCGAFSVSHGSDYCSNCGADMLRTPQNDEVSNNE